MGARGFLREKVADCMFDELDPYKLSTGTLQSVRPQEDSGWLVLNFSEGTGLILTAESNDDTIVLREGPQNLSGNDVSSSVIWRDFIDMSLVYGWFGINHQGYIDTAMMGFGDQALVGHSGAVPSVVVTVVASALKVSRLSKWQSSNAR